MESSPLTPVTPVKPVAPWLGGKRNLAKRIVKILDGIPHQVYAEPFLGMGGVFLRRTSRPRSEVINDYSRDVANLFRILQRHYPQFLDTLRFQLTTRTEFNRLVDTNPDTLTDLERAARFLYLQRTAFGGKVSGRNFGVSKDRPARFNLTTLEPDLEDLHTRLSGVVIECLGYAEFIARYDGPGTLFYLDPPYWGNENDYGKDMFGREDFARLAQQLAAIEGRFLMSINDLPEVRELFGRFELAEVQTSYTVSGKSGSRGKVGELLVTSPSISDSMTR
ncbi:DNA adenine methylase [Maritimibacter sp. HL-12]|uniref:DNA adenine methylase n=1 Tax=Maritimibacter sp. HL-12 TaxID=1162418 RepID=UPI000A0F1E89|nr:DNA adenine methylase [Maritimibacter sp. HL-12]SMH35711.1 DNA adenine methylase [Maritimibacter sp. HL-12]